MPQFYQVLKADPIGDPYTPSMAGAKPLQSFWCQVEGVEEGVMISKQVPNTPSLTEGHYGVLEQRTSKKGNQYWKFTSMQMPQGTSKPRYDAQPEAQAAPSGVSAKMFHELEQRVTNLETLLATPSLTTSSKPETTEAKEGVGGGEITKEELEDIFGGEMADPVDIPSNTEDV